MRVTFQEELDQLEANLQEEGALVLRVLRGALNALAQRDVELADEVISFDDDVDRLYIQIQQEIESLLARQTPVAIDLRLVLALLHVNLHLERMADYSVTIAKLTKLVADVAPDPMLLQSLQEMGERAEEMIRVALDSLANRDLHAAESLVDLDELIDRSNRRFVERVVEIVAEPGLREWVLRMVLVSRTLERIGDHAVDIGEQVAYLLTAEFREFTDASHPKTTPSAPVLIAQLSDVHVGGGRYREELLRTAIAEINDAEPDVVVVAGDLTDDGYPGSVPNRQAGAGGDRLSRGRARSRKP